MKAFAITVWIVTTVAATTAAYLNDFHPRLEGFRVLASIVAMFGFMLAAVCTIIFIEGRPRE